MGAARPRDGGRLPGGCPWLRVRPAVRTLVLASSRTAPDAPAQIAAGERPCLDYLALADALGGDVLDARISDALPAWRRRLETALSSDIAQAEQAWGRRGLYRSLAVHVRKSRPAAGAAGGPKSAGAGARADRAQPFVPAQAADAPADRGAALGLPGDCLPVQHAGTLSARGSRPAGPARPSDQQQRGHGLLPARSGGRRAGGLSAGRGPGGPGLPDADRGGARIGDSNIIVASSLWALRGGAVDAADLPANVTLAAAVPVLHGAPGVVRRRAPRHCPAA